MNASADGDEPLGEHVDVTMPRATGLIDRQAQALTEIRAMHELETTMCIHCSERWPCRTVAIFDRLGV